MRWGMNLHGCMARTGDGLHLAVEQRGAGPPLVRQHVHLCQHGHGTWSSDPRHL